MVGKRHYSKLGPRQELLRIQKALFNKNKRIISETISIQDKDFLDYEESYHQELKHYEREAKIEELYDVFEEFPIILMGDFHTNKQSQRSFLRVIRGYRKRHSNFVIALEAVHAKKQKVLDKFIAGEIELADLARKLDFKKNFHFNVWSHFKAIFEFAFFHKIKILALEAAPFDSGLKKRDQEMVKVIAQSLEEYPRHKVFVLVGDLHIAEKNLPSLIYKNISYQNAAPKVLKIFQNYEGIYWSLAEKALENSIELVKVSENAFCLLNTPPLVWQQGYLHHLDHEDEIDYTDLKQQFLDILVRIAKFLGLQIPSTYEEIEVFTWNDLSLIDSIEKDSKFTNLEKSIIKEKINKGESYFISKKNWVYLGDMSLNHVAEQACFYLKYLLIGEDFPRSDEDAFYANVLRWTKAYFASKVINHKRKTSRERDYKALIEFYKINPHFPEERILEVEVAQLLLEHQKMMRRKKVPHLSTKLFNDYVLYRSLSRNLGSLLGEKLFYALLEEKISKPKIADLFQDPYENEGECFAVYWNLYHKTKSVKVPMRM